MSGFMGKAVLGIELLLCFYVLFWWINATSLIHHTLLRAKKALSRKSTLTEKMDMLLLHSGLNRKIPLLTTENWILLQIIFVGAVILIISLFGLSMMCGVLAVLLFGILQYVVVSILIAANYRAVDEDLLKFLDFLGNYSVTSGEITSILYQVSEYMDEPLRSVLEECCYEAQTLGDPGSALLSMIEKIPHPKFGEVVRNIEVTMRYSANFTILVNQSRRAVRENMKMRQERKSLAREAWINMIILGVMAVVIFMAVESLTGIAIENVLFHSWIGRSCLIAIGVIMLLFYRQVRAIDR